MTTVRETRLTEAAKPEEQREALDQLMDDAVAILNGGIRIGDQFRTLKLKARWNSDAAPLKLGPFDRPIRWLIVLGASRPTSPSARISTPPVSWTQKEKNVEVTAIASLTSSTDYDVDFLCLEG
jgi:hypothetical protein